jgi:hypothetical protein
MHAARALALSLTLLVHRLGARADGLAERSARYAQIGRVNFRRSPRPLGGNITQEDPEPSRLPPLTPNVAARVMSGEYPMPKIGRK